MSWRGRRGETLDVAIVVGLVLAAAWLRARDLTLMSLWTDEGLSFYRASLDLAGVLRGEIPLGALVTRDVQPPLYFLLLRAFFQGLGSSTWSGRALSTLASLPTIPLLWALGRRWAGRRAALWAAALAAFAPVYLWHAQEARAYTLSISLALLSVYALDRALWPRPGAAARMRVAWAAACVGAGAAMLWTHYLGFFVAGFEAFVALVLAWRRRAWKVLAPLGLAALLALPLLPFALRRLGTGAEKDQLYYPPWVIARDALRAYPLGRAFDWQALGGAGTLLSLAFLALALLGLAHLIRARRRGAWLAPAWLVLPTAGFWLLTTIQPRYQGVRHILLQSPPYFLLLGAGIAALGSLALRVGRGVTARAASPLVGAAVLLVLLWADRAYYLDTSAHKGELRGLAGYVAERALPGDALVLSDPVLEHTFRPLLEETGGIGPELTLLTVPPLRADGLPDPSPPAAQYGPLLDAHPRLWTMRPPHEMRAWLEENARLVDEETFPAGYGIPVRVSAWEAIPEPGAGWPEPVEPLGLGALELVGWEVEGPSVRADAGEGFVASAPLVAGRANRVRLAWLPHERERPDYKVALRVLDEEGRDLADGDHEPFRGEWPTSAWPFGEVLIEPHELLLRADAAPGRYRLGLLVYDPATGETFPPDEPAVLGEVDVVRPDAPIRADALPLDGRLAGRGPGLRLLGWEEPDGPLPAGAGVPLRAWLRVEDPARLPARARFLLLDALGRRRGSADVSLDPDADAGELRVLEPDLYAPAEEGRYRVRLQLLDAEDRPAQLWRGPLPLASLGLAELETRAPERRLDVPAMTLRLDQAVGDDVVLLGADLPETTPRRGERLPVTLWWRAERTPEHAYHVTLQLLPLDLEDRPAGPPVVQQDGVPAEGRRPTTGWAPGEVVEDPRALPLPSDLPPGRYGLVAALYDPSRPDLPRPEVVQAPYQDPRDFVILAPLTFGEAPAAGATPLAPPAGPPSGPSATPEDG